MDIHLVVNQDHLILTIKLDAVWARLPIEARLRFHEAVSSAREWLQALLVNETQ